MRAPSQPQTNLPAAPPMKTSASAVPTSGVVAPLALSRNGRKVSSPMRTDVSSTPIAKSRLKPVRAPRRPLPEASLATVSVRGMDGRNSAIAAAAMQPSAATIHNAWRQGMSVTSSETAAGSAALPRSPEKL